MVISIAMKQNNGRNSRSTFTRCIHRLPTAAVYVYFCIVGSYFRQDHMKIGLGCLASEGYSTPYKSPSTPELVDPLDVHRVKLVPTLLIAFLSVSTLKHEMFNK